MVPEATLDESALMPAANLGMADATWHMMCEIRTGFQLRADEHIMTEAQAAIFLHMSLYRLKQLRQKKAGPSHAKISKNVILYTRHSLVAWVLSVTLPN